MARLPRLVVAGQLHLLVQRSHAGHPVFRSDADFASYRSALIASAAEQGVAIHAYALTPSQVLLLVTPQTGTALSRMLQAVGRRFGADYNRRHGRSGVLWEGRFRTTVVDADAHFLDCCRHVEWQPVLAGLVATPQDHAWSSAGHHGGQRQDAAITEHRRYWSLGNTPFEREASYRRLLEQPLPATMESRLSLASLKGWAVGDAAFIQRIEAQAGRRVAPLPRGRPRRHAGKKTVPK
ncbi:MAG TPA: transposase [Albitalea sp.]|nr:transposase [Albitalea sp.]